MKSNKGKFRSVTQSIKFITGILSWVVLILLVIVAAFLLYYFVSMKVYAQKGEAYRPPISLYTILTQSMVPNINPNDVIVDIKVEKPEDIKIGDVITFVSSATLTKGMTITHRVVDIKVENGEYQFFTKGDANIPMDGSPAKFSNILGKVLFRVPKLGLLQQFLATRGGWLIVVVIPALCIIISDILKLFRLKTAKDQVVTTLNKEEEAKKREENTKIEIEARLAERYGVNRKETEPDPLPKKNYINLSNGATKAPVTKMDLPIRIDLPKLRTEEKSSTKEAEKNTVSKARNAKKKGKKR